MTTKRIRGEIKHFMNELPEYVSIYPNPNKLLEIFFLLRGDKDSHYSGGEYLGKIIYGPKYPLQPPNFYLLTPNGRFHTNKKICLSNSGYHSHSWSPAGWNILTILTGLYSLWHSNTKTDTVGIGHLKTIPNVIKKMALQSKSYNLKNYSDLMKHLSC